MFYHSKEYFILSQLIMARQIKKSYNSFCFQVKKDQINHQILIIWIFMEDGKKLKLKMHQNVFCFLIFSFLKFSRYYLEVYIEFK